MFIAKTIKKPTDKIWKLVVQPEITEPLVCTNDKTEAINHDVADLNDDTDEAPWTVIALVKNDRGKQHAETTSKNNTSKRYQNSVTPLGIRDCLIEETYIVP